MGHVHQQPLLQVGVEGMPMRRRTMRTVSVLFLLTLPLAAQQTGPPVSLPDHWMTLDSLALAVGLDTAQRTAIAS
ncbi:MAG: hypothetical protein ACREMF_00385, partial [Gemmatimonadales bacterium]